MSGSICGDEVGAAQSRSDHVTRRLAASNVGALAVGIDISLAGSANMATAKWETIVVSEEFGLVVFIADG